MLSLFQDYKIVKVAEIIKKQHPNIALNLKINLIFFKNVISISLIFPLNPSTHYNLMAQSSGQTENQLVSPSVSQTDRQ